jgi:methylase of polypeptide subunit release factors
MEHETQVFTWLGSEIKQWPCGDRLAVFYRPRLDGGGTFAAGWFLDFFRARYPTRRFKRAFEWCAGPGFIGFSLLEAGICDHLVLADVNSDAVDCVRRTVDSHPHLHDRVTVYLSDNFHSIPDTERFDLVVSNPPYAVRGNPRCFHDRRTLDSEWKTHADFFANVGRFLAPESLLCISEFSPLEADPEADALPPDAERWDLRTRAPIEEFLPMIRRGGLRLIEIVHATGSRPVVRLAEQMAATATPYTDWFWILVIVPTSRQLDLG